MMPSSHRPSVVDEPSSAASALAHRNVCLLIRQAGLTNRPVLRPDRNVDEFTKQQDTWHVVHNSKDARVPNETYTDIAPPVRVVVMHRGRVTSDVSVCGKQATWLRRLMCILHQKRTRQKDGVCKPKLAHLTRTV